MNSDFKVLLKEISSSSPTPGGGSVSALAGSLGASLVSMVCNLTIGKKKYKDVEEKFKDILTEAQSLQSELLILAQEDMDAFNEVMSAFKMADEKEKTKMLDSAYKNAATVPLKTAKNCLRVITLAKTTTLFGNKNAQTDSVAGALLAYYGMQAAILNVKINLKNINDQDFCNNINSEIRTLENESQILIDEIKKTIESNLSA
jgi:formiminotetrahydrofolate cyclodeaminase